MIPLLVAAFLSIAPNPSPVRWSPLGFEKAAWVNTPERMLLTDLGTFQWKDGAWEFKSYTPQPFVSSIASRQAVFLTDELVLGDGEASATLIGGATQLLLLHRGTPLPLPITVPAPEGLKASSLRLLITTADEWLLEGVTFAGDARLGVFIISVSRKGAGGSLIVQKGGMLPSFAGGLSVGDDVWLIPEKQSDDQTLWIRHNGRWRTEAPPTSRSVLLDAVQDVDGVWLAFSDGVLVVSGAAKFWFPLTVGLVANRWICEPQGPHEKDEAVQGRWLRGDTPLGWGTGHKVPLEEYPMDGASCAFFTNAAAVQGLATPDSVKISLTAAGSLPVKVK